MFQFNNTRQHKHIAINNARYRTDRQTDRQTNRQADRQTDRETDRFAYRAVQSAPTHATSALQDPTHADQSSSDQFIRFCVRLSSTPPRAVP